MSTTQHVIYVHTQRVADAYRALDAAVNACREREGLPAITRTYKVRAAR